MPSENLKNVVDGILNGLKNGSEEKAEKELASLKLMERVVSQLHTKLTETRWYESTTRTIENFERTKWRAFEQAQNNLSQIQRGQPNSDAMDAVDKTARESEAAVKIINSLQVGHVGGIYTTGIASMVKSLNHLKDQIHKKTKTINAEEKAKKEEKKKELQEITAQNSAQIEGQVHTTTTTTQQNTTAPTHEAASIRHASMPGEFELINLKAAPGLGEIKIGKNITNLRLVRLNTNWLALIKEDGSGVEFTADGAKAFATGDKRTVTSILIDNQSDQEFKFGGDNSDTLRINSETLQIAVQKNGTNRLIILNTPEAMQKMTQMGLISNRQPVATVATMATMSTMRPGPPGLPGLHGQGRTFIGASQPGLAQNYQQTRHDPETIRRSLQGSIQGPQIPGAEQRPTIFVTPRHPN